MADLVVAADGASMMLPVHGLAVVLTDPRTVAVASVGLVSGPVVLAIAERHRVGPVDEEFDRRRAALVAGASMAVGGVLLSLRGVSPGLGLALGAGLMLVVIASMVDVFEKRIPNRLTYPAIGGCLVVGALSLAAGDGAVASTTPAVSAFTGGLLFAGVLLLPHLIRPDAMGLGDVKLAFPLGFAIGWVQADAFSVGIALGWTIAGAAALGLLFAALQRQRSIAFGPALSAAAVVSTALLL